MRERPEVPHDAVDARHALLRLLEDRSRLEEDLRQAEARDDRLGQLADLLLQEAQVARERLDVGEDEGRRVVDLVGDAGGEHADRGQLLGLQAPHLVLALVGRVAQRQHRAAPRDRVPAQRERAALEREAPIEARARRERFARNRDELGAQRGLVEAAARGVRHLERAARADDAEPLGEGVEGLAQDVALGADLDRSREALGATLPRTAIIVAVVEETVLPARLHVEKRVRYRASSSLAPTVGCKPVEVYEVVTLHRVAGVHAGGGPNVFVWPISGHLLTDVLRRGSTRRWEARAGHRDDGQSFARQPRALCGR